MAIKANRIESFSRDFNIPVLDFQSSRDLKDIFNAATNDIPEFMEDAKNLASQIQSNIMELIGESKDFLDSVTREAKNQFDKIVGLAGASETFIKDLIDDVFGGFPQSVINTIKNVGSVCRNNALGAGMRAGKNFFSSPNCGTFGVGNSNCPPGVTQGLLGTVGTSLNRALKRGLDAVKKGVMAVASLLSMGYNANLCNVLTSVMNATGIGDKGILGIAAASVLSGEGLKGSVNAVIDIAKSNIGNLAKLAPAAVKNTAKYLALGSSLNSNTIKHVSDTVVSSFDLVDPEWSGQLGMKVNTAGLGLSNDFTKISDYKLSTSTFDTENLDEPSLSREQQVFAGTKYNAETKETTTYYGSGSLANAEAFGISGNDSSFGSSGNDSSFGSSSNDSSFGDGSSDSNFDGGSSDSNWG